MSAAIDILNNMSAGVLGEDAARELLLAAGLQPDATGRLLKSQRKVSVDTLKRNEALIQ